MQDLERAPGRLRFADPAIERRYRHELVDELRAYIVVGHLVAVAAWACGAVVLVAVYPELTAGVLPRIAVGGGALAVAAALIHRAWWPSRLPIIVGAANVIAGVAMIDLGHRVLDLPIVGYIGVVMALFYATTIYRLPLVPSIVTTVPYVALEIVAMSRDHAAAPLVIEASLLVIAWVFGIAASVLNERHARTAFVQRTVIARQQAALDREQAKSERLLRNMLPDAIAARLRDGEVMIADGLDEVTILFADLVGFTRLAADRPAAEVVAMLSRLFTELDQLAHRHGLEKIKTIGDSYMAAAGVPEPRDDHADAAAAMALDAVDAVAVLAAELGIPLRVRIGLHSGPVIAGVIGRDKLAYDLWGDSVNTAARMESHGVPDAVQVTDDTRARLTGRYRFEARDAIDVKGKGPMRTWLLQRG